MPLTDVAFSRRDPYSVVLATCGYERRSSYLARIIAAPKLGLALIHDENRVASFDDNFGIYRDRGWLTDKLDVLLDRASAALKGAKPSMAIDISSMPRSVMAAVVEWIIQKTDVDVDIDFLYCPADFAMSAAAASRVEQLTAGPIDDYFSGAIRPPTLPIALIMGLGLERYRGLGMVELLEPSRTWAFVAQGEDSRFAQVAMQVHDQLLNARNSKVVTYDVYSLASTYQALESLCFGLGPRHRIVLAPSGPKIFSLASMLVAATRSPFRPAVWRVGSAGSATPADVIESGEVIASRVRLTSNLRDLVVNGPIGAPGGW